MDAWEREAEQRVVVGWMDTGINTDTDDVFFNMSHGLLSGGNPMILYFCSERRRDQSDLWQMYVNEVQTQSLRTGLKSH